MIKKIMFLNLFIGLMFLCFGLTHWQIEIVYINICNGWPTGWPFCIIWENPWAAKDFFYLLQFIFLAGISLGTFALGKWIGEHVRTPV